MFKKREFTQEERSVRGILVTGLTEADMAALDIFEGTVRTFFRNKLISIQVQLIFVFLGIHTPKSGHISPWPSDRRIELLCRSG